MTQEPLADRLPLDLRDEIYRLETEVERLRVERANRYWEGRWRDEKAENERLKAALAGIACWSIDHNDAKARANRALEPKP